MITSDTPVMEHEGRMGLYAGTAAEYFGADLARLVLGDARGENYDRAAYDWWPVTLDGMVVGELRDDAAGLTLHVTDGA